MMPGGGGESPAAELITVFWALALVTTLLCELGCSAVNLALRRWPQSPRLELLSAILLFAAVVIGALALAALALVLKVRRVPPSIGAVGFAAMVCAAPLALVVYRSLAAAF